MPPPFRLSSIFAASPGALLNARHLNTTSPVTVSDYLAGQWKNPSDILAILLLWGPETIQAAVAALAGRAITPVAFSFGWAAYAAKALSTFSDGAWMPDTDVANALVVGAETGHVRMTKTWVLGRLIRDLNIHFNSDLENERPSSHDRPWEALRVSVFEVANNANHGVPTRDWVWYSGFLIILVQLGISIIPWIISSEWGTFLITLSGSIMALVQGSLSPWKAEKWACRRNGSQTVTLTQGNGSRHAIVILRYKGAGLNLEMLAQGNYIQRTSVVIKAATVILAVLWITLMVTVSGLKINTWYLFGISLLGSIQNIAVGIVKREPQALGFYLMPIKIISGPRVAGVLKEVEENFPMVGSSLLPIFFPGSLRVKEEDVAFWRSAQEKRHGPNKWGARVDNLPKFDTMEGKRD